MKKEFFGYLGAVVLLASVLGACQAAGEGMRESKSQEEEASLTETNPSEEEAPEKTEGTIRSVIFLSLGEPAGEDAARAGVRAFAEEKGLESRYMEWQGEQTEERLEELVEAEAARGDSLVVCMGDALVRAEALAATRHPQTKFAAVGGGLYGELPENFSLLSVKREEAGFLAGYGAVWDGADSLGFIGRDAGPESRDYGYGFLQGADAAALEMEREISFKYLLVSGAESGSYEDLANGWYETGTDVIFSEDRDITRALAAAAEKTGGAVAGLAENQDEDGPALLASVQVDLEGAVYSLLSRLEEKETEGLGRTEAGAGEGLVGLSMENSGFREFTPAQYGMACESLKKGDYRVMGSRRPDGEPLELSDLTLTNTEVQVLWPEE